MSFALITNTSAVGTDSSVTTSGLNTTGANLLVVGIAMDNGGTVSLSDSKSNTWTALTASNSGATRCIMYYAINPIVGTSHTFTNAGAFNFSTIYVTAFKGAQITGVFDQQNGAAGTGATTLATGSVTPSVNDELIVAQLAFTSTGTTISINSSFNKTNEQNFGAGNNYGGAMAYLIQTTAGAVNPTWTRNGTQAMAARIATFRANTSGFNTFM